MALYIFDLNNNPLLTGNVTLNSNEVKIIQLIIECHLNYVLKAGIVPNLTLEAKRSVDLTWINLTSISISLNPWDGTRQQFDFRFTAGNITVYDKELLNICVRYP